MSQEYDYRLLRACGDDVFISSNVEIRRPHLISVGNHVAFDSGLYCTTAGNFGDYIHIAPYTIIIGGEKGEIVMKNFSGTGPGCRIICASDEYLGKGFCGPTMPEKYRDEIICKPVVFERFTTIGANVVVMPGVVLGEGSIVGACSLVKNNTEPWTINIGTPAKPVRKRPKEKMLKFAKEMGNK